MLSAKWGQFYLGLNVLKGMKSAAIGVHNSQGLFIAQ